jgi:hypothetical protein
MSSLAARAMRVILAPLVSGQWREGACFAHGYRKVIVWRFRLSVLI